MTGIKTLVYFDLEATGLKNSGRPRICELSLLAVNFQDVSVFNMALSASLENVKSESDLSGKKLGTKNFEQVKSLCLLLVSDLTGLDNYNLTGQSKFNKSTGNLIDSFLNLLPSSVCLVAHNRNAYDFPLLMAELEKSGTNLNSEIFTSETFLFNQLLCINIL